MASYCEVCCGMYFPPHQHALLWRRASSRHPCDLLPPLSRSAARSMSPPSHQHAPVHEEQRRERRPCGLTTSPVLRSSSVPPGAPSAPPRHWGAAASPTQNRPFQQRSFSEPVRRFPRPFHESLRGSGAAATAHRQCSHDSSSQRHIRTTTPPPLPSPALRQRSPKAALDSERGFAVDTFNSLLRTEGRTPPFEFLRRGEGVTGTRYPMRPPSHTSPPLPPAVSPPGRFLESFDPLRALAERCCYPSTLAEHRRHEEEEEAEEQPQQPSGVGTSSSSSSSSSHGAALARKHQPHRPRLSASPNTHFASPIAERRFTPVHEQGRSSFSPVTSTTAADAAPKQKKASLSRPVPPQPASLAGLPHPLGDLIEQIRPEVRADTCVRSDGVPAEAETKRKSRSADQARRVSDASHGKMLQAGDADRSLSTSTPASSSEAPSALTSLPPRRRGRHAGRHQQRTPSRDASGLASSVKKREEAHRPPKRGVKDHDESQTRASPAPPNVRHLANLLPESASQSASRHGTRYRPRASSASSSSSASFSATQESLSSSAQLQRAVRTAQTVLQQMRRRGTQQDGDVGTKGLTSSPPANAGRGLRISSRHSRRHSSQGHSTVEDSDRPHPYHHQRRSCSRAHSQARKRPAADAASTSATRTARDAPTPAQAALAEEEVHAALPAITARLERQQRDWCGAQDHNIERLREGLASLCVAVRKDLRRMRDDVAELRTEVNEVRTTRPSAEPLRGATPPAAAPTTAQPRADAFPPDCVLTWVGQCTSSEQRRLAQLLLPHLRPSLTDVIGDEVARQLRSVAAEQQAQQRDAEARLRAYVDEAITTADRRRSLERADDGGGATAAGAPLWAGFSSVDAFNAHLRATARAVLLEEDERRYSLVSENEQRHARRVREMQRHWQETLAEEQLTWRAAWKGMLEKAEATWTRRAQAPLQEHADLLQTVVTALTKDVTHLQGEQDAQATSLRETLQSERAMRQREQARLAERVEQQVLERIPKEVEKACVRYHVQRSARVSSGCGGASLSASPSAQLTAEELRLSVVQPALDHMRRLLVSHQEMMTAAVEDRCRRAEGAVESSRDVWLQKVKELRALVSALRSDVRGAFHELCTSLDVASPAM